MPKKRVIKRNDDTVLWQKVINQVKPLKSTMQSAGYATSYADTIKPQNELSKSNVKNSERTSLASIASRPSANFSKLEKVKRINPVDLRNGDRAGIDSRTQRRLFRGEVPVDRRLDLHGMTAAYAQGRLVQFIEMAVDDGCRCVLVITGKGSGVLRGYVPEWLKQPPLAPLILALAEARPKDGGGGALYVLLRRKRGD